MEIVEPTAEAADAGRELAQLLANEWHPTKNGELRFGELSYGSGKKVWWLGRCGHEWESEYRNRTTKGTGCPVCSGHVFVSGINDLATIYPEVASEWHPTRNGGARPDQCASTTNRLVWWLGNCGHEWKSSVSGRTSMRSGCPYCSSRKLLTGFNDLKSRFPEVAAEWHPSKNGDIGPESVSPGSTTSYWWICRLGHPWKAKAVDRTHGANGCPICSGRRILSGANDLETIHPDAAAWWHSTRNGPVTARDVTAGSKKKYWWRGPCGHDWEASPGKITSGRGCPVCRGLKVLPGYNDLASRNPELVAQWHQTKNGSLTPEQVTFGSMKKVWWSGTCGHEWEATVTLRANAGTGCPFCRGLQIAVGDNDFASRFPNVAAEWHPTKNGALQPTEVTSGLNLKVWWLGKCGHEWLANISGRTGVGAGCPRCVNRISRPEMELFNELSEVIGDLQLNVMVRAPWGSNRQRQWCRCDMLSDELRLVIEYDGWFYHRDQLTEDMTKTKALIDAGWFVIRVRARGQNPQNTLPEMPQTPGLGIVDTQHGAGGLADAKKVLELVRQSVLRLDQAGPVEGLRIQKAACSGTHDLPLTIQP
ncbi:zinc-ribbon domain-containing protein [Pseudarthrobacter sp. MM222]|uniref:zinc-ribbon domain-containing protein n=1 Tax=Pseudarthrobacter sp. MM222 TaxID=3018929 RepID=UPI00221FFB95|nr:zinc-ribbon domain-containing protein [Pseudarthrobacter sp. MM222]